MKKSQFNDAKNEREMEKNNHKKNEWNVEN